MKGTSVFDYAVFYDDFNNKNLFAASKQKYTENEARVLFELETGEKAVFCQTQDAAVIWRAGVIDNEPHVGWWLEMNREGTEPRYCPVWVFEY